MKLKVGLDIHGVITDDPDKYRLLAETIIRGGGEIHILSGSAIPNLKKELEKYKIPFTHIFSITTHHEDLGAKVEWIKGLPYMADELWDPTKAEYCKKHGVHFMIDDSPIYEIFFDKEDTHYLKFGGKKTGGGG